MRISLRQVSTGLGLEAYSRSVPDSGLAFWKASTTTCTCNSAPPRQLRTNSAPTPHQLRTNSAPTPQLRVNSASTPVCTYDPSSRLCAYDPNAAMHS
eukprot:275558-Rhodomonas_salina.1